MRSRLQAFARQVPGAGLRIAPVIAAMLNAEGEMLAADPDLPLRRISPRASEGAPASDHSEEVERRAERAEAALRQREEQLSMMAHDLRGMLSPVMLLLGRLRDDLGEAGDVGQPPAQARVDGISNRLKMFIDRLTSLLDATRLQNAELGLDPELLDLPVLVRGVVDEVRAGYHGAAEPRFTGLPSLQGAWDRARLEQIVRNLVSNAYRFGGHHPFEIDVDSSDQAAVLTIRDRGPGIPPADHERIFEKHVRLQQGRGFGLGLWIVKQLVEAMAGSITVASVPGVGSEFRVELPISPGS